ncbi:MAG: 4Fe-4S dicluster domain-containing protein [Bacteroidales bacterium]|nr:4Fe-4S dicluster domain-containing protein [Bacteroidales bacterium]
MFEALSDKACCGCQACVDICPKKCLKFEIDEEGFGYPKVVDETKCIQCDLCNKTCPVKKSKENPQIFREAYYGFSMDEDDILKSSSGGLFAVIAKEYQKIGYYICGATYTNDFKVQHQFVAPDENVEKLFSSKYAQSDVANTFTETKQLLKQHKKVLYSGLPCQIAALKSFLQFTYDGLITIDLLCYGVQSPKVWDYYLNSYHKGKHPTTISMRSKHFGWKKYAMEIEFSDGKKYLKAKDNDPYLRCYSKGLFVRPCCYNCHFKGFPRISDLTLGDFWEVNELYPNVQSDRGVSIIIPNSKCGEDILKTIEKSVWYSEIDMNRLNEMNIQYLKLCKENPNRSAFFNGVSRQESFDVLAKKYAKISRSKQLIYGIKKCLYRNGMWEVIKPFWNLCKNVVSPKSKHR